MEENFSYFVILEIFSKSKQKFSMWIKEHKKEKKNR